MGNIERHYKIEKYITWSIGFLMIIGLGVILYVKLRN
jgi:hypothetical protein